MKSIKNGWYPEKGTVWNVCWIFWRKNRKGIAVSYHKAGRYYRFLPFGWCWMDSSALSQIRQFQLKNCKLQQFLSEVWYCWRYHPPHHFFAQIPAVLMGCLFLCVDGGCRMRQHTERRYAADENHPGSTPQVRANDKSAIHPPPPFLSSKR